MNLTTTITVVSLFATVVILSLPKNAIDDYTVPNVQSKSLPEGTPVLVVMRDDQAVCTIRIGKRGHFVGEPSAQRCIDEIGHHALVEELE